MTVDDEFNDKPVVESRQRMTDSVSNICGGSTGLKRADDALDNTLDIGIMELFMYRDDPTHS